MDMPKAFDRVDDKILMKKFNDNDVKGNVSKLFESYLSSKQQLIVINRVVDKTEITFNKNMVCDHF